MPGSRDVLGPEPVPQQRVLRSAGGLPHAVVLALFAISLQFAHATPCADLQISALPAGAFVAAPNTSFEVITELSDDESFTLCWKGSQLATQGTMHTRASGRSVVDVSSSPGLTVMQVTISRDGSACSSTQAINAFVNPPSSSPVASSVSPSCLYAGASGLVNLGDQGVQASSPVTLTIKTSVRSACPAGMELLSGFCKFPRAVRVAAGVSTSLVVMSDQSVYTFGQGAFGVNGARNGIHNTSNEVDPAPMSDLAPFLTGGKTIVDVQIGYQGFMLLSDGGLLSWGQNMRGTLGRGGVSGDTWVIPGLVPSLPAPVASFSLSPDHSVCAVLTTGALHCWGQNNGNQLGRPSISPRTTLFDNDVTTPSAMPGGLGVTQVICGTSFSIALLSDGTVASTGNNYYGNLGHGTSGAGTNAATFGLAPGLTNVAKICWGQANAYAIKTDGTVWGWGQNSNAQLGLGVGGVTGSPTQIASLNGLGVTNMYAGYYAAFAQAMDTGTWYASTTIPGHMTQEGTSLVFVEISNLAGASQCSTVQQHGICVWPDGTVKTWGVNEFGQGGVPTNFRASSGTKNVVPLTVAFH